MKYEDDDPIQDYSNKGAFFSNFLNRKKEEYEKTKLNERASRSSKSFGEDKYKGIKTKYIKNDYTIKSRNYGTTNNKEYGYGKIITWFLRAFYVYVIFSFFIGIVTTYNEYLAETNQVLLGPDSILAVYSKNSNLDYSNSLYDKDVEIEKLKEIKFNEGTKIPTLYKYIQYADVKNVELKTTNNVVAEYTPVVEVTYFTNSQIVLQIFGERIVENENYKKIIDPTLTKEVYVREEGIDKFSFIIIDGTKITYGLSYGEPKIKNY